MYAYIKDNTLSFISFAQIPAQIQDGYEEVEDSEEEGKTVFVPNMIDNPTIEGCEEIEYNSMIITDPVYEDGEIVQRPHIESDEQKKSRIIESLISADSLEDIDLEGALFSDQDIGEIILQRVFGGNKFGESALQGKISAYILSVIQGTPNTALFSEIADKQAQVNEVRVFFGLTPIA